MISEKARWLKYARDLDNLHMASSSKALINSTSHHLLEEEAASKVIQGPFPSSRHWELQSSDDVDDWI